MNNRRRLHSWWFRATSPLQVKSARWIADGQIWLSTYCSAWNIQTLCIYAGTAYIFLSFCPPFPSGEGMGVFFKPLPLFTWFFVLACHIVSLSDDTVSLWAHNEEVVSEHRLVSLHWGYHTCLVPVWTSQIYTRLYDDGLCLFKKKVNRCFLYTRHLPEPTFRDRLNPVIVYISSALLLQYLLNIKH